MPTVGQKAPEFTLFNSERQEIALSDFAGKNVVILFFPMAFTSVCTTELCEMRDNIATYTNLNAEVLAISVDSPFTLAKFKEDQQLPFNLLSDFNKEVSQAYDTYYETFVMNLKGVSKRSAFVIDGNGIVQYAELLESAGDVPSFSAIQQTLATLQ
ncbi:redoxin domain-containing protein [Spirosoma sp. KUDC1026]|uniref:redoxin domain-containing protein n=1 Tax=Spirosoma sp. KUDC1026 TaxID=2745947 RepID=UPI00159BDEBA|nr:peroxiredoxin [Spirosoma sp. KUDC1026]QKZ14039.1 peroxiredoxin [Spirosoma sp. KUDC1026]